MGSFASRQIGAGLAILRFVVTHASRWTTRLCEALFDAEVGTESLDPSFAIYTDLARDPDPPPVGLASDLIASRTDAILVIDDCPAQLRGRLTRVAQVADSTISVVTVEYDARDDQPGGTEVFALDSSSELIAKLILRRYQRIRSTPARSRDFRRW